MTRIKVRSVSSIHPFYQTQKIPRIFEGQKQKGDVAVEGQMKWVDSFMEKGRKSQMIKEQIFFSILSHLNSLLGFEFGVRTSITLSMKHCHQEHSMPPFGTSEDHRFAVSPCTILKSITSQQIQSLGHQCISSFLIPSLTRESFWTFPSLPSRRVKLQTIIPLGTLEN